MATHLFVKFQYNDKIKKLRISKDYFKWDNFLNILSSSFDLPPHNIRLTYKDPEGDEITVCTDGDLLEAFNTAQNERSIRFIIYSFPNQKKHASNLPVCHIEKELPQSISLPYGSSLNVIDPEKSTIEQMQKPKVQKKRRLRPENQEIENLFNKILLSKEIKREIQGLRNHASLEKSQDSNSDEIVLEIDSQFLTEYLNKKLNEILNESEEEIKMQDTLLENTNYEPKGDYSVKCSQTYEEEKISTRDDLSKRSGLENALLDVSLKETIYEKSVALTNIKASFREASTSLSKELPASVGVKLALKNEGGKMTLVSIPSGDYTIIDSLGISRRE